MKAILLCDPSANQRGLAARLHAVQPLAAIGLITLPPPKRRPTLAQRLAAAAAGYPLRRAWFGMLERFHRLYPEWPEVEVSSHLGVNSDSVRELVEQVGPDVVLVSGTDLLRQPLIEAINRTGHVINLHTGISPYIKGGPNCTNWCLALGEFRLIGNTVMWLDAGIDSGRLIATERTPLSGRESLVDLQIAVMDHGQELYARCYGLLAAGRSLPSVPQEELGPGRLFLTRHWTPRRAAAAVWNFHRRYRPSTVQGPLDVALVSPEL